MKYVLTMARAFLLGQVQVHPANVEQGRVLRLRPGLAASRLGRVLDRAIPLNPESQ